MVELLEVSLLLSSLLLVRRGKQYWGAVLLTLAALTKESALLVAGAAALIYVVGRLRGKQELIRWHYFTLPIATFLILQTALLFNWRELPLLAGKMNIGIPFSGFISFFLDASTLQTPLQRRSFPELILLTVFAFGVIWSLRSTAAAPHEKLSWFLYSALALSMSRVIWVEDWAYLRAVSEFCVLGMIIVIGASSRTKAIVLGSFSTLWLFIFIRLLRHGD